MNNILTDLEALVKKHKGCESDAIIRWIPICEKYKNATTCQIKEEMGGRYTSRGKDGECIPILVWLKVRIEGAVTPSLTRVTIIDTVVP